MLRAVGLTTGQTDSAFVMRQVTRAQAWSRLLHSLSLFVLLPAFHCCTNHCCTHHNHNSTTQQAPVAGVVEFGDVEDEPDYQQLAAHKQQHKQHGGQATGSNTKAGGRKHASSGKADKQQQQAQKPQPQKLTQLKTGELTHAEPNVPAESRLQLFGAAGAGGAAAAAGVDDSSWSGLGLSEVLSGHLEALNFQEPTQVSDHTGVTTCVT